MAQRNFFATADDLLPVFGEFEGKHRVKYTLTGLFETASPLSVAFGVAIPTLRSPAPDSAAACPSYLITPLDANISVRVVPQRKGGVLYAIDQLENPDSTTFCPGGFHSDSILLYGRVATGSDSAISQVFYSTLSRVVRKHFVRIKTFYVGKRAVEPLESGCRLAAGSRSPVEYDLAP